MVFCSNSFRLQTIFLFFILTSFSYSQKNPVDSLKYLLKKPLHDTERCNVLIQLSELAPDNEWPLFNETLMKFCKTKLNGVSNKDLNYRKFKISLAYGFNNLAFLEQNNGNYDKAIKAATQALSLQKDVDDKNGMTASINNLGALNHRKNNLLEALSYYHMGITLNQEINNQKGLMLSYNNIGRVSNSQGNYVQAISYYEKSLKIAEKNNFKDGIATSLYSMALIYFEEGEVEKAREIAFKSLKISQEAKDREGITFSMNFIGSIFLHNKDYNKALEYYEKALRLREDLGDKRSIAMSYQSIGTCYNKMGNNKKALEFYNNSLNINTAIGEKEGIASNLQNIGSIYIQNNQNNLALKCYIKSLEIARKIGYKVLIRDAALALNKLAKNNREYKDALEYYQLFIEMKENINNEESKKAVMKSQFKMEFEKKEQALSLEQEKRELLHKQEALLKQNDLEKQKTITYSFMFGSILLIALVFLVFRNLRQSKNTNIIINKQKTEVELQKEIVESKQKEILDSINYAKRIQYALLAHDNFLSDNILDHFVYFKPKDIVSGDFYWATKHGNKFYLAVCDCTGHGVPGAFMSILNIGFLTEAIKEKGIEKPNDVFNFIRQRLIDNISKEGQKDGFDGVLICFDKDTNQITYAAANNSPILIKNTEQNSRKFEVITLPKDRMPVGIGERKESFNLYTIDFQKNDTLYLYTDGYPDQFGGANGKKYKYKTLNDLLLTNTTSPLLTQKKAIENSFENWRGNLEQVDDVCVIGLKF